MDKINIELRSCRIREWRRGDKTSLIKHANNRNVSRYMRDRFPHPYTETDADRWLKWVEAFRPQVNFAIDVCAFAVGGIGIEIQGDIYRCSAEIGYWLGEDYWGRGIMTEAVVGITDYALGNFNLSRVYAGVFENNPASARVLEKAGYQYEGKLRKSIIKDGILLDQLIYAYVI